MVFSFSTENFEYRMKAVGTWQIRMNHQLKHANGGRCRLNSTPKFRKDCMMGERMLVNQIDKVIESGFIKTNLDYEELARDFHLSREQVTETLNSYYRLVNGRDDGIFRNIEEIFNCLVTSDEVLDYHWSVLDNFFESATQPHYYAMGLTEAVHLERRECCYFCLLATKLSGGDCFLGDGFVKVKSGFVGERYVQTVFDLSWFLAGKIIGLLDEKVTPMEYFRADDWREYNKYPTATPYITKVMEKREDMPSGVTTCGDIEDLFDDRMAREMLLDKVIPKGEYLDIKLLEWATKIKGGYREYAEIV